MNEITNQLLKLIRLCKKSELAYTSAARFCKSGSLTGIFKAHALERKEYQDFVCVALDKMGVPLFKSRNKNLVLYQLKTDLLNYLSRNHESGLVKRCLTADRQLVTAYEDALDCCEEGEDLCDNLRKQFNELRKTIQELTLVKETTQNINQ